MSRPNSWLAAFALLCFAAVPSATADPITLTGGTIWVTGFDEPGSASLTGIPSFSFLGLVDPLEGRVDPFTCRPCLPGSTISVGGNLSGSALPGVVTFLGNTYDVGSQSSPAALALEFFGDAIVVPALSSFPALVTVPFTANGNFFLPDSTNPITGSGVVSVLFRTMPVDRAWVADQVRYEFSESAPVPEPATLTTVAFGLAVIARAARTRRSHSTLPRRLR